LSRIAVIGLGRIGLRLAWELKDLGYEVVGVDASSSAADRAERLLGVEVRVADVTTIDGLKASVRDVDLAAVALPGSVGHKALLGLVTLGVDTVDVSFSPEDPYGTIDHLARKKGVIVVVDAGVAPGLSNMLVGMLVREMNARKARILVGGVSADPNAPLGLSATWSIEDLLDEYLRKARYIRNGQVESVDPLSKVIPVKIPGVGEMEAIPTDGLRTMLRNLSGLDMLVEYTLRWPGHSRVIKELLHINMLDESPITVGGCPVAPRRLLAKLLESRLTGYRDMVILITEAWSDDEWAGFRVIVEHSGEWTAMSIATASFQAAVADLLAKGKLEGPGVVAPEELALTSNLAEDVLNHVTRRGVKLEKLEQPVEVINRHY
jgi:saccharopine dehydrogenase-like NADP-dependent oxidoreductase